MPDGGDGPVPLVVTLGSGDGQRASRWYGGWYDRGVALAFPDARDVGRPDDDDGARWDAVRDPGFVQSLVATVRRDHRIDDVYIVGFAAGGRLAWGLLCTGIEGIAGYAIVAEGFPREQYKGCATREPLLVIAGTEDRRSPWGGDERTIAVTEAIDMLARRHSCSGERLVDLPDRAVDDQTRVVRHDWTCHNPLQLLEVKGGGRAWPGTDTRMATRDIDGADEILAFFGEP
jgi:poly(3-hydroxybutyrate) depolymerase